MIIYSVVFIRVQILRHRSVQLCVSTKVEEMLRYIVMQLSRGHQLGQSIRNVVICPRNTWQ